MLLKIKVIFFTFFQGHCDSVSRNIFKLKHRLLEATKPIKAMSNMESASVMGMKVSSGDLGH